MRVLVAHGTRSAAGVETIEALRSAVSTEIGSVRIAFVDVLGPDPAQVLGQSGESAVLVPAFLASGHHVHADLPARIAHSGHSDVTVTRTLGPDRALATVMYDRLRQVGWQYGDTVVMAAAGSSDPRARSELRRAVAHLAELVVAVQLGFIATGTPRVRDVVAGLRAQGERRVFVASYLLAPGLFHDRLHECGATAVAPPLGAHPAIVDLLISRFAVRTGGGRRVARPCRRSQAHPRPATARADASAGVQRDGHRTGSPDARVGPRSRCA